MDRSDTSRLIVRMVMVDASTKSAVPKQDPEGVFRVVVTQLDAETPTTRGDNVGCGSRQRFIKLRRHRGQILLLARHPGEIRIRDGARGVVQQAEDGKKQNPGG